MASKEPSQTASQMPAMPEVGVAQCSATAVIMKASMSYKDKFTTCSRD